MWQKRKLQTWRWTREDEVADPDTEGRLEPEAVPLGVPVDSALPEGVPLGEAEPVGLADDDGLTDGGAVADGEAEDDGDCNELAEPLGV
jgi:hypothetical protein